MSALASQTQEESKLELVIPLFNEEHNVTPLIEDFEFSGILKSGLTKVILVNNGSTDNTGAVINGLARSRPWILPIHLRENQQYGGGVHLGLKRTSADFVGYLPGDHQISAADVKRVWLELKAYAKLNPEKSYLAKGRRQVRMDSHSSRLTSQMYTKLSNQLLELESKDVNGLPKIFHRSLLDHLPINPMKTFIFEWNEDKNKEDNRGNLRKP